MIGARRSTVGKTIKGWERMGRGSRDDDKEELGEVKSEGVGVRWQGVNHLEHWKRPHNPDTNIRKIECLAGFLCFSFSVWLLWHSVGRAPSIELKETLFTFWKTLSVNYVTICVMHPDWQWQTFEQRKQDALGLVANGEFNSFWCLKKEFHSRQVKHRGFAWRPFKKKKNPKLPREIEL